MKPQFDLTLYLVTDPKLSDGDLPGKVDTAIQGGVTLVQLREKTADSRQFLETALRVREVTDRYGIPLIINDRIDIALACNAAGVHLGQQDIPCKIAREILGPDKLIGVTAKTVEQAIQAERDGADYLGCGALFPSGAKPEAQPMTLSTLSEILASVHIPVTAIGGINAENVHLPVEAGANGVAVVSAILGQPDVSAAARKLREKIEAANPSG
ncbi:MAG TPA: thiamine phosphate synthase [Candidatus Faecivivens stercoripullorum]|uniref:Thiamine-phosphate synthase n=1 Tax=Candidatus Faecivivens stercoripullorum TaxID=2840805 RepID=A0A9D1H6W4_9FIRM|nr:thiamine phosphate synthase [Candidatus Faecivivens stercoripullorum]